jgi:hypothetical protein
MNTEVRRRFQAWRFVVERILNTVLYSADPSLPVRGGQFRASILLVAALMAGGEIYWLFTGRSADWLFAALFMIVALVASFLFFPVSRAKKVLLLLAILSGFLCFLVTKRTSLAFLSGAPPLLMGTAILLLGMLLWWVRRQHLGIYALMEIGLATVAAFDAATDLSLGKLTTGLIGKTVAALYGIARGVEDWQGARRQYLTERAEYLAERASPGQRSPALLDVPGRAEVTDIMLGLRPP